MVYANFTVNRHFNRPSMTVNKIHDGSLCFFYFFYIYLLLLRICFGFYLFNSSDSLILSCFGGVVHWYVRRMNFFSSLEFSHVICVHFFKVWINCFFLWIIFFCYWKMFLSFNFSVRYQTVEVDDFFFISRFVWCYHDCEFVELQQQQKTET